MADSLKNQSELPLVTVILPFKDRISLVKRAILSVLSQTYKNYELLLINDGSIEPLALINKLIFSNDNIKVISLAQNMGASTARNVGLNNARGKYIAFLDSDDEWIENKLEVQIINMIRHEQKFSFTSYIRIDVSNNLERKVLNGRNRYRIPFLAFHCPIATPSVVVDVEAIGRTRFKDDVKYGEDVIFWYEIAKKIGGSLSGIDLPLCRVYVQSTSAVRSFHAQNEAYQSIRNHCFKEHQIYSFLHKIYSNIRLQVKKKL